MHLQNYKIKKPKKLETIDKWMLASLNELIKTSTESFEVYAYSQAKAEIDNFFWNTFCDFYLEIIKDRIYNPDKRGKQGKESAQYTLYITLNSMLKLLAPIMPFVTEEVYQKFFKQYEKQESIHKTKWPGHDKKIDKKLIETGKELTNIIKEVRMFKTKNQKSLKEEISLMLPRKYKTKFDVSLINDLKSTTKAVDLTFGNELKIELKNG